MSGTSRMSAWPATGRLDALGACRHRGDGVVEGQRAVEHAARDLTAIGHLAQRGRIQRGRHLRIHGLDRGQHARPWASAMPSMCARSIAFCTMSHLVLEGGRDVDRRIGDEQRAWVGRNVHERTRGSCGARCADRGFVDHRLHQLVGVQRALHERLDRRPRARAPRPIPPRHGCAAPGRSGSRQGRASSASARESCLPGRPASGMIRP